MTVKELKAELNQYPDQTEVWVCDEIEGNDSPLQFLCFGKTPVGKLGKFKRAKIVLLLRSSLR